MKRSLAWRVEEQGDAWLRECHFDSRKVCVWRQVQCHAVRSKGHGLVRSAMGRKARRQVKVRGQGPLASQQVHCSLITLPLYSHLHLTDNMLGVGLRKPTGG